MLKSTNGTEISYYNQLRIINTIYTDSWIDGYQAEHGSMSFSYSNNFMLKYASLTNQTLQWSLELGPVVDQTSFAPGAVKPSFNAKLYMGYGQYDSLYTYRGESILVYKNNELDQQGYPDMTYSLESAAFGFYDPTSELTYMSELGYAGYN